MRNEKYPGKRHILITGRPGVGKTTLIQRLVDELSKRELKVIGFYTAEIREGRNRVGFRIMDVSGEKRGILSHVDFPSNIRIGKYRVNVKGVDDIIIQLRSELEQKGIDVCVIDEIGPMELRSKEFGNFIREQLYGNSPRVMGTIKETALHLLKEWNVQDRVVIKRITEKDRSVFNLLVRDIVTMVFFP